MPRGVYARKPQEGAVPDMKTQKRAAALAKKVRETGRYELEPEFKTRPDGTTTKLSDLKTPPKESPLIAAADLTNSSGPAPALAPLPPAEPEPVQDAPEPPAPEAEPPVAQDEEEAAAPTREPVTPVHLIRMTHPDNGTSDGFQTDATGAILVPHAQVTDLQAHGFVIDHAKADMMAEEDAEEGV